MNKKQRKHLAELFAAYFPDSRLDEDSQELAAADGNELLTGYDTLLPYLQTAFFKEHLLEIQLDWSTRIYFANILDDLPPLIEELNDGEMVLIEEDYEPGSYLKSGNSLVITPLSPGLGNVAIRKCEYIVIRYFSGTDAIEFGCTYRDKDMVRDIPVLRLNFPEVGRVNKSYRAFRVKAISAVEAYVECREVSGSRRFQMVDISAMGMGFEVAAEQIPFAQEDTVELVIHVPEIKELTVRGCIRHISKVRDTKGFKNICGVQFDLETRSLAAEIEQVAAAIQRIQLREMAEKMAELEGVCLIR